MRTLAFDGRMGASGDMLLGALLAVGADPDALAPVEAALDVRYDVDETDRNGIAATSVTVRHTGERDDHADDAHAHPHDHTHEHEHDEHTHDHADDAHEHPHAEGAGPKRSYREVVEAVEGMALPDDVEARALAVFEVLASAEAAVHGADVADVHFHEVGADDAIADVVGVCLLLADLDPERVVTTPVSGGGGRVEMSHGTYPVPAPAVVELASEATWALAGGPVDAELLTPTGAAILAVVADGVPSFPPLRVAASGYGAGDCEFADHANVLRALLGESEAGLVRDDIRVLETNLDDAPPEILGGLQETLADAGARDVTVVPTTMKKSRPGHLVKVIVKPEDAARVARRLAEETGTLGVREGSASHRWIAERAFETAELDVEGETYEVSVKVASDAAGEVYDYSAEYDDAAAVARETGLPIREVVRRAEAAVRE